MKNLSIILIILLVLAGVVSRSNHNLSLDKSHTFNARRLLTDWCALTCGKDKQKNIACEVGGRCGAEKPCNFDKIDIEEILETHNKLRNIFASGHEPFSGAITVSNMRYVQWDENLAFTAKCNLAKCLGTLKHDHCHITPDFKTSGQNLWYYASSRAGGDCVGKSIEGVFSWYDEIKLATPEEIKGYGSKFDGGNGTTGHFTQLIWADVTHIGCALTKNEHGGKTECLMACNYGPAGNVIGGKAFKEGEACSQCPDGLTCGGTFEALCGSKGALGPNALLITLFVLLIKTVTCLVWVK